jgi:hypothetical protein
MPGDEEFTAIGRGIGVGLFTFVSVEIAALVLAVAVKLIGRYTKWFYFGEQWSNWLGVVFLYGGYTFGNLQLGLIVCARAIKSHGND